MSITYKVYTDGGTGTVDYTTPVLTTSALTATIPAIPSGPTVYAVRATDTASGLEEQNTDARVTVSVGGDGSDLTGLPLPPSGLLAVAAAGGSARVEWAWPHAGTGTPPTGFRVYVGTPSPDFARPAATVPYRAGVVTQRATLAGLTGGTAYAVTVRAFNASGEEANTVSASVTADATPPTAVTSLAAAPSF